MRNFMIILVSVVLFSCESRVEKRSSSEKKEKAPKNGITKTHYPDGTVQAEVPFRNGKRHGVGKQYYSSGKLQLEINYAHGKKHGLSRMFFENGTVYEESLYDSGNIDGIQKKYRQNGQLAAEMPYRNALACMGVKEYLLDGTLKKKYPTIVITPVDEILKADRYTLQITMSDNSKTAEFWEGTLDGNCLGEKNEKIYQKTKGVGEISFYVPQGAFLMREVTIVAKTKTPQGNYFVTTRKHNVAVENR